MISNIPPPTENVRLNIDNVAAYVETDYLGHGSLIVAQQTVCWAANAGQCFQIPYEAVSAFAISRDLTNFPHECILMVINRDLCDILEMFHIEKHSNGVADGDHSSRCDAGEGALGIIRFVPNNKESLPEMYTAIADGLLECPVSGSSISDDGDYDEQLEGEDNVNG